MSLIRSTTGNNSGGIFGELISLGVSILTKHYSNTQRSSITDPNLESGRYNPYGKKTEEERDMDRARREVPNEYYRDDNE